ncbi:MAG: sulfite exporter TauE/SafE family protein, partial [Bacteroidota bacterium]
MGIEELLLTALIFAAAVLYSSVGHAGASGYLAAMALFDLAPEVMRPAALALNILVASLATYRYTRAGQNDIQLLIPFVVVSIPAAFIGGLIHVPHGIYKPLIGIVLLFSAFHLAWTARKAPAEDRAVKRPEISVAMVTGAGLGLLAGLSGTGGGIFLSPLLLMMHWAPTRSVSGIASTFILLNSISGLAGTTFSIGSLPQMLPVWA